MMTFTPAARERLHKTQAEAAAAGLETFFFEGASFNTSYARYLLEYLDSLPKATKEL